MRAVRCAVAPRLIPPLSYPSGPHRRRSRRHTTPRNTPSPPPRLTGRPPPPIAQLSTEGAPPPQETPYVPSARATRPADFCCIHVHTELHVCGAAAPQPRTSSRPRVHLPIFQGQRERLSRARRPRRNPASPSGDSAAARLRAQSSHVPVWEGDRPHSSSVATHAHARAHGGWSVRFTASRTRPPPPPWPPTVGRARPDRRAQTPSRSRR